jgi:biotin transport system ATP-binding protein
MAELPLFSVEGLTRRFPGSDRGLFGLSTEFRAGEFVLLAGSNGSGKTLLIKHLLALEEPTSGRVLFRGQPLKKVIRDLRGSVGMIFQHPEHQIIETRVRDDVAFGLRFTSLSESDIETRTGAALSLMGLEPFADAFTHTLSGGEKRRLALAGMLALEPEMLILDEPFNELDLAGMRALTGHLEILKRRGTAILLVSHDLEKTAGLADRVICLHEGRLVLDGAPGVVFHRLEEYGVRNPLNPWRP